MSFLILKGGEIVSGKSSLDASIKEASSLATIEAPVTIYQAVRVVSIETKTIVSDYNTRNKIGDKVQS